MQLYSTNDKSNIASLREAVFRGLPADKGLYMPMEIPELPAAFLTNLSDYTFQEIAFEVAKNLLCGAIQDSDLEQIVQQSITFPAPVVHLDEHQYILELFHGPSLAFKDFGARFMAQLMSYFNRGEDQELTILVATSGDTGGAVAAGFYQTPGIRVIILYPSGKVSFLQEKQLTTLGENITALEIDGTFDDCQTLVKQAFLDPDLNQKHRLSSANSINIARLIPQSFYYFEAYKQIQNKTLPIAFCVPSGNFGNLTAGLFAKKMGLPVHHFIAATNVNDVVPAYLQTSIFTPRPSVRTLSNAMDVGNPSNFSRMLDLYCSTWNIMREDISGYAFTDEETKTAIREVKQKYRYIIDPHGAVGYLALNTYLQEKSNTQGVILETAHPAKFKDDVETILGETINVPERLSELADREKIAVAMSKHFDEFKTWLLEN